MVARTKALNGNSVVALGRRLAHGCFESSLQALVGELWYTIDYSANSIQDNNCHDVNVSVTD